MNCNLIYDRHFNEAINSFLAAEEHENIVVWNDGSELILQYCISEGSIVALTLTEIVNKLPTFWVIADREHIHTVGNPSAFFLDSIELLTNYF